MKRWIAPLVALALAIGLIGTSANGADAAKKAAKKNKGAANTGQIDNISGTGTDLTITVSTGHGKKATKNTVTTNKETSVTVDGQAKALSDLKTGQYVKLDTATGVVKTIDASTSAPAGDKKKDKKKKKAA
jgi:hypothetical protein